MAQEQEEWQEPETEAEKAKWLHDVLNGKLGQDLGLSKGALNVGLSMARKQMIKGAFQDAFQTYSFLVLCEPVNLDFQLGLANCAMQMHLFPIGLQAASSVISEDPSHSRAHVISGCCALAMGLKREALEDLMNGWFLAKEQKDAKILLEAEKYLKIGFPELLPKMNEIHRSAQELVKKMEDNGLS